MYILYVEVSQLTSARITNTTLTVQWDPAISPSDCGPVFYDLTAVNSANASDVVALERRGTTAEFSNLKSGTLYNISVAAVNRAGTGPSSVIIQTTLTDNKEGMYAYNVQCL